MRTAASGAFGRAARTSRRASADHRPLIPSGDVALVGELDDEHLRGLIDLDRADSSRTPGREPPFWRLKREPRSSHLMIGGRWSRVRSRPPRHRPCARRAAHAVANRRPAKGPNAPSASPALFSASPRRPANLGKVSTTSTPGVASRHPRWPAPGPSATWSEPRHAQQDDRRDAVACRRSKPARRASRKLAEGCSVR